MNVGERSYEDLVVLTGGHWYYQCWFSAFVCRQL